MKIRSLLPLTLVLALGIFSSCSKEIDEVNPDLGNATSMDAKKDNLGPAGGGPTQAILTLTFNPSPVYVNETAAVSVTINGIPEEGEMQLWKAVDEMGNHTTAELATDWEAVVKQTVPVSGQISYNFISTAAGMYGFKAKYVPKGGSGFLARDVTGDIEVIMRCAEKLTLTGEATATHISGNLYRIEVTYTVAACEDMTDLKLQGGITAHSSYNEAIPAATGTKETGNGNIVTTWEGINIMGGATKTYKVIFEKELKSVGSHTVTGNWSVKGKDGNKVEIEANADALTVTI